MNELATETISQVALTDPTRIITLSFTRLNIGSLTKPEFRSMLIEFETLGGTFSKRNEYPGWIETIYIAPKFTGEARLVYHVYQYLQNLLEED